MEAAELARGSYSAAPAGPQGAERQHGAAAEPVQTHGGASTDEDFQESGAEVPGSEADRETDSYGSAWERFDDGFEQGAQAGSAADESDDADRASTRRWHRGWQQRWPMPRSMGQ